MPTGKLGPTPTLRPKMAVIPPYFWLCMYRVRPVKACSLTIHVDDNSFVTSASVSIISTMFISAVLPATTLQIYPGLECTPSYAGLYILWPSYIWSRLNEYSEHKLSYIYTDQWTFSSSCRKSCDIVLGCRWAVSDLPGMKLPPPVCCWYGCTPVAAGALYGWDEGWAACCWECCHDDWPPYCTDCCCCYNIINMTVSQMTTLTYMLTFTVSSVTTRAICISSHH